MKKLLIALSFFLSISASAQLSCEESFELGKQHALQNSSNTIDGVGAFCLEATPMGWVNTILINRKVQNPDTAIVVPAGVNEFCYQEGYKVSSSQDQSKKVASGAIASGIVSIVTFVLVGAYLAGAN